MELPGVGGEDGNLGGLVVLVEQVAAQRHRKVRLVAVLVAPAVLDLLLWRLVLHEEQVAQHPLTSRKQEGRKRENQQEKA